jgi:Outer membrane protein beta-barrel domain
MYLSLKALVFIGLLGGTSMLHAQASATATRSLDFKVGGGFTTLSSDYLPSRFNGGAVYADLDFTRHFGAEAEFHFAKDSSGSGEYEKTYEIGGRYFRTYGRFVPYAKVLWGRGVYNFTQPYRVGSNGSLDFLPVANLAYNLVAAGAGADYKLQRHFYVRGDWEYQHWFSFQGSSLSPNLITVGLAYHFR